MAGKARRTTNRVRISAMFHTPLAEITFEQIENFCRTFPEGVRVEYKRELIKDIPKVISSFANSSGGIWIIGV